MARTSGKLKELLKREATEIIETTQERYSEAEVHRLWASRLRNAVRGYDSAKDDQMLTRRQAACFGSWRHYRLAGQGAR